MEEEIIERKWKKSILNEVINYCSSSNFKERIKEFKLKYLNIFEDYIECKTIEDEEQSLECTEVFHKYQELIEELLEDYVLSLNSTIIEFYQECQSSLNNEFTVLFEEHEHKWFVEALLAWLDYDIFFKDMISAVKYSHK